MPGIFGADIYRRYKAEMEKIVSSTRHNQLMEIDPEYAKWAKLLAEPGTTLAQRQLYRKKIAEIVKSYGMDLKFQTVKANRDKLIIMCLPLVLDLAKKYIGKCRGNIYFEDLVGAGNLGAVIGVDKVLNTPVQKVPEYSKLKYTTYVYNWIRKYIMAEAFGNSTGFGGTVRDKEAANKYATILIQPKDKDGEDYPNDLWDVDRKQMKTNDFKDLIMVEDEAKRFQAESKRMFSMISKRDREVLFDAYGIDTPNGVVYTQAELAKKYGVTQGTISKWLTNILWKLQRATKGNIKGEDLIAGLALIQGVDMSKIPGGDAWKKGEYAY